MIVCPKCGSKNVAPIVYGAPDSELLDDAEKNQVILGGCCITDMQDDYGCCDCKFQWARATLDIKYVKTICIKLWNNGLSSTAAVKEHVYDIYPDGQVKYSVYKGDAENSELTMECSVFTDVVNKLHKEIQHILSSEKKMQTFNTCGGTSYSLTISYTDNRNTVIEGNVVGYPLDQIITEFIDNLQF